MNAAWGWLFFSFALMKAFILYADFYMLSPFSRGIYITLGDTSCATGALFFIYIIEGVGVIKSKHVFTAVFLVIYSIQIVLVALFISNRFISFHIIQSFSTLYWAPIIILISIYLFRVNNLVRGKLKGYSILMIVGISIIILGYFGATDLAIRDFGGLPIRFLADISSIVGIGMVGWFFSALPSWREIEWHTALDSMFVIYKGGICIYQNDFGRPSEINKDQSILVGSVIEIIKSILQEAISEKLRILNFKNKKILFEQGASVSVAMIADVESESLKFLLHKFLTRFERFFKNILKDWDGDNSEFEPTKGLIKEIFE